MSQLDALTPPHTDVCDKCTASNNTCAYCDCVKIPGAAAPSTQRTLERIYEERAKDRSYKKLY